jgi:hypothetical protein
MTNEPLWTRPVRAAARQVGHCSSSAHRLRTGSPVDFGDSSTGRLSAALEQNGLFVHIESEGAMEVRGSESNKLDQLVETRRVLTNWANAQTDFDLKYRSRIILGNIEGLISKPDNVPLFRVLIKNKEAWELAIRCGSGVIRPTVRQRSPKASRHCSRVEQAVSERPARWPHQPEHLQSPLVRAIAAAVPLTYPEHIRGPACQNLYEPVATGTPLNTEIVRAAIRQSLAENATKFGPDGRLLQSLDAPIGATGLTLYDVLADVRQACE